jgi:hypothetical protein
MLAGMGAFGIADAALVVVHWQEPRAQRVGIRELLRQPPGVFAPAAVIVIAATYPIERRGIDTLATWCSSSASFMMSFPTGLRTAG